MKWKRILIAIAIALLAVVGLQCFWLFRQYSTQRSRLRQQLGDDTLFNVRSLQVFVTKLRHRLEHYPRLRIVNVRGIGYKLIIA
jgi:DNA-binding response OmpR family regulator